jgi:hypothetical protein
VDESQLRQVAKIGLRNPAECEELAVWSNEYGEAAADARYMLLARTLSEIAVVWEEDGALSRGTLDQINRELANAIPSALDADMEGGMAILRTFRDNIQEALRSWANEKHRSL